jgi:RimJ/RimL family protein N-acetyltransferase/SAM-dependent methyltransferase
VERRSAWRYSPELAVGNHRISSEIESRWMKVELLKSRLRHYISPRNFRWMSDPEVTRHLTKRGKLTLWGALAYYQRCRRNNDLLFAIYFGNQHVGNCGFFNRKDKTAELRIMIGERSLWGKGIGSVAVEKMLEECHGHGISRVWLSVSEDNPAALQLYKKMGFVKKGSVARSGLSSLIKMELTIDKNLFHMSESCPLCSSDNLKKIHGEKNNLPKNEPFFAPYLGHPITLIKCCECGFAFVQEIPKDPQFYAKLYSHKANWEYELRFHGKRLIFESAAKRILKYIDDGKLLDVGSSIGTSLEVFKRWFNVTGIELDEEAVDFATKEGFRMICSSFEEAKIANESYEVVTLIDVLEHLPDAGAALRKVHKILKNDGILFIKVPNYISQMRKQNLLRFLGLSKEGIMGNYAHINHFCKRSLTRCLQGSGFTVLEAGYAQVELWNLEAASSPWDYIKRLIKNTIRLGATAVFGLPGSMLGLETEFHSYVLARKERPHSSVVSLKQRRSKKEKHQAGKEIPPRRDPISKQRRSKRK